MMQIRSDNGPWRACPGTVLRGSIAQGQHARRQHSGNRSKAGALERAWARKLDRTDRQEKAERRLAAKVRRELGLDRKDVWGRGLRLRLAAGQRPERKSQKRGGAGKSVRVLPSYRRRIVDAKGRIAVFFRIRYMGLKSPKWRAGCTVDHAYYIMRVDALETIDGQTAIVSNMGKDPDEIAGCWKVLEEVERAYRANAKVQYRIIVNLPHELTPEQRLQWVETYCDRQFGRYGLPFVAALHKPDGGGDQRNFHAHICFSTRPVERAGDYEWEVAEEKVTDLARKENLLTMRAEVAAQLNRACRKAGVANRYTHLSYAARKLNVLPQEHAGPERTAAYRNGDDVKLIAQNSATIERNDALHRYRLAELATMSALCFSMREWATTGVATCAKAAARAEEIQAVARLRQLANAAADNMAAAHQRAALFRQQRASHQLLSEQAHAARNKALAVRRMLTTPHGDKASSSLAAPADNRLTGKLKAMQLVKKTKSIRTQAIRMCVDTNRDVVPAALEQAWHLARTVGALAKAAPTRPSSSSAEVLNLGRSWNAVSQVRHNALRLSRLAGVHEFSPPDRSLLHAAGKFRIAAKAICAQFGQAQPTSFEAKTAGTHSVLAKSCQAVRTAALATQTHLVEPSLNARLRTAGKKLVEIRMEALTALSSDQDCVPAPVHGARAVNAAKKLSSALTDQGPFKANVSDDLSKAKGGADQGAVQEAEPSRSARLGAAFDVQHALSAGSAAQEW